MKIYTKSGDKGETTITGYERVKKNHPYIEAVGSLDELNSVIGVTLCFIEDLKLRSLLVKIQNDLFTLGADLAGRGNEKSPKVREEHIKEIEKEIDELEEKLGMPKKFILPNGTKSSSFLHLCRTITRRVERNLINLENEINPEILSYVNRLSDLFYVCARQANKEVEFNEQQPMYKYFNEDDESKDEEE